MTLEAVEIDADGNPPPAKRRPRWQFWRRDKKPKRPILIRLFGLSLWGAIKLTLTCILVGFIMLTMQFDPADPTFDASSAIMEFARNTIASARWAVTNFWKPALTGATIVLPIWILWRLATLPFRK
ncbi:MAG: hypothetical protein AAFS13_01085 [Pseudomonadota bacterium]